MWLFAEPEERQAQKSCCEYFCEAPPEDTLVYFTSHARAGGRRDAQATKTKLSGRPRPHPEGPVLDDAFRRVRRRHCAKCCHYQYCCRSCRASRRERGAGSYPSRYFISYILTYYIHTYIHTYMHAYILTYIHTYIHTYIYSVCRVCVCFCVS